MPVQSISPLTSSRVAAFLGADGFAPFSIRSGTANTANALSSNPQRVALQNTLPVSVTGVLFDATVSGVGGLGSRQAPINATALDPLSGQNLFAR